MTVTPVYVQLPSDAANTGKKIESVSLVDDNSNTVYREMVSIGDPAAIRRMSISARTSIRRADWKQPEPERPAPITASTNHPPPRIFF
jgi:hypothetical protein